MQALWHWLTELAEVYARYAIRHSPQRLLRAEVLPTGARRSLPRRKSAHNAD